MHIAIGNPGGQKAPTVYTLATVRTVRTTGTGRLTSSDLAGILIALIAAMGGVFTFWNTRQANQIKLLYTEAEERRQQRVAEREADRLDKEAKQKEFDFWRDNYSVLSKQYNDEHASYVALATKHEEFRRDHDTTKSQLLDVTKLSERQSAELDSLKSAADKSAASLSTAQETISSMNNALQTERANYDSDLTRMNNDHMEKQAGLQRQIDKLTTDLKAAQEQIIDLHRQIQDFNSVNMQLARKVEDQETLIEELQREKADLQRQLDALTIVAPPQPEPPEPPTPDHKAPIPGDFEPVATLPKASGE